MAKRKAAILAIAPVLDNRLTGDSLAIMGNRNAFYIESTADATAIRHQQAAERIQRRSGRISMRPRNVPSDDTPRVWETSGPMGTATLNLRSKPNGPTEQDNIAAAVKSGNFDAIRKGYNDRNGASGWTMDERGAKSFKAPATQKQPSTASPKPAASGAAPAPGAAPAAAPGTALALRTRGGTPQPVAIQYSRDTPKNGANPTSPTVPSNQKPNTSAPGSIQTDPALWTPEAIAKSNPAGQAPLPTHPNDMRGPGTSPYGLVSSSGGSSSIRKAAPGPMAPRPMPSAPAQPPTQTPTPSIAERNAGANNAIARSKALRASVTQHEEAAGKYVAEQKEKANTAPTPGPVNDFEMKPYDAGVKKPVPTPRPVLDPKPLAPGLAPYQQPGPAPFPGEKVAAADKEIADKKKLKAATATSTASPTPIAVRDSAGPGKKPRQTFAEL